jgi:hypothetical protein
MVTALGPTIVAVGFDPIGRKFLKKQHDTAGVATSVNFKVYEPAHGPAPISTAAMT